MRRLQLRSLCAAVIVFFAPSARADQPPTLAAVLANVRGALGADHFTPPAAIEASGRITRYGVEADFRLVLDADGRFRQAGGGVLGETRTFDGTDAFAADWTGAVRHLQLQDRDLALQTVALCTSLWAVRPAAFDLAVLVDQCTDKEVVLSVKRKDGRFTARVTLDRGTWLPVKASGSLRDQVYAFTFDDYRAGPGLKLPWRWSLTVRGVTTTANYTKVERAGTSDAATFRLTPRGATRAVFDRTKPGDIAVKKAKSGHLLIRPTVAGKEVGWFILDSGAGYMTLDKKLVDQLGFLRFGEVPVGGAVGKSIKTPFVQATSLELGPVTLNEPICIELDLQWMALVMGETISGIVGYPLFQSAAVEVDCAQPALTLHDPATYQLPAGAAWQKLVIDNYHPLLEARYEGDRGGWFLLDTGMAGTVIFHTPTVRKEELLKGRATKPVMLGGITGAAGAASGTLEWFELGGHRFASLGVMFAQSDTGAFANEYAAGNLGQAVCTPFRVVFDFGHERIAFVKKPAVK